MTAVDMEVTRSAVLDEAHVGDIRGALGTIRLDDTAARTTMSAKFKTLLAIVGPGLIVMIGDNDAGAFSTYGQAGQDYGTRLLWTLLLLIPVLYVNQEMVLRLGAVTGVGHARLILARLAVGGKSAGAVVADHHDQAGADDREQRLELGRQRGAGGGVVEPDGAEGTADVADMRLIEYSGTRYFHVNSSHGVHPSRAFH